MTCKDAVKINVGDVVIAKSTNKEITVVSIEVDEQSGPKAVFFKCSDGLTYHHSALM